MRAELDDLVERWFGQGRSAMGAIVETADGEGGAVDDIEHLRDLASEAPVIRLVNLPAQGALPRRWRAGGGRKPAGQPDRGGDQPHQDHGPAQHRRTPPAAGRPDHAARAGQGTGPARKHRTDRAWRERGDAPARPRNGGIRFPSARLYRCLPAAVPQGAGTTARHPAGHRPDRFRQDHHAVYRAQPAQHRRRQDHHRRRPGRIPDRGHQPDPGQAADRPGFRQRPAQHRAPGPGHHHDR
ncbi:hypothetical protein G6F40_013590 [Rhizopus arrhizus]|nr:hypothetical protein G6F40_013590 [Rhizopus arrhizus]